MAVERATADTERTTRLRLRAFNDEIAEATDAGRRGFAILACECGREECSETLSLTYTDYEAVRDYPDGGRFIVVAGHEDGRRVLAENARAALIEVGLDSEVLTGAGDVDPVGDGVTRRVLIVDDDAAIRMICSINLAAEGFSVIEASDGKEGLELARSEHPDLIVTDVKMPRLGGFEFTEALRDDEKTREIPVVFMTGDTDATHESRAKGLGALAFLEKPFEPRELVTIALGALA